MFGAKVEERGGRVAGRIEGEVGAGDRIRAGISIGEQVKSGMRLALIVGRGLWWALG